jgi:hypothetical protein|nr:MAG: hypothetical protein [Lake Baikal virophage 7]
MWVAPLKKSGEFFLENGKQTTTNATMDIRSFTKQSTKDAEIDRLNEEAHPADNTPHTTCGNCDCCIACGCCECVVCPRCDRTDVECEKNKEGEKNPITDWCGGWGLSCDDCYYRNHPEEDEEAYEDILKLLGEAAPLPELHSERRFDVVSAEIVPDSPKKATRPLLVVRGVNTRELFWAIPAEIDLDDQETYEYGDKWGTLYITNKKTGQEWELEAKGGEEDFKRCDETHIESYDEHSWWWGDDEE